MTTDELWEAIEVVVQDGDMRLEQREAATAAMEDLRALVERLQAVERRAGEQSAFIQQNGLTEFEVAGLRAENSRLRQVLKQIGERAATMTGTPMGSPRQERNIWQWMGRLAAEAFKNQPSEGTAP